MTEIISIEGLGKAYTLYHRRPGEQAVPYGSLRDVIAEKTLRLFRRAAPLEREMFWALKDLTLTINQGDKIAFIGPNGAGKSTLLKILSRITEPTTGRVAITGRVSSLLEVGTGFHQELSGRENIYLNGAILGMNRREITQKFEEIVDFSGIEDFLDMPVKRYSSGMAARLGFSVAAHLSSEILIVDEVLAVGDAAFQQKSVAKMNAIAREEGRTILFVSHTADMLRELCTRGVVLNRGQAVYMGGIEDALNTYAASLTQ